MLDFDLSYLFASHHIVEASMARRRIGIQMNHAAPAYSPLTTVWRSARPDRVKAAARPAMNGCSFSHPNDASHGPIAIPRTKPPAQRTHPELVAHLDLRSAETWHSASKESRSHTSQRGIGFELSLCHYAHSLGCLPARIEVASIYQLRILSIS